jgi:hypothetical protein
MGVKGGFSGRRQDLESPLLYGDSLARVFLIDFLCRCPWRSGAHDRKQAPGQITYVQLSLSFRQKGWNDGVGRGLEDNRLLIACSYSHSEMSEWCSPGNLTRPGEDRVRRRQKGRQLERPCNVLVFWMKVVGPKECCRWKVGRRSHYGRVNESECNEATTTKWTLRNWKIVSRNIYPSMTVAPKF